MSPGQRKVISWAAAGAAPRVLRGARVHRWLSCGRGQSARWERAHCAEMHHGGGLVASLADGGAKGLVCRHVRERRSAMLGFYDVHEADLVVELERRIAEAVRVGSGEFLEKCLQQIQVPPDFVRPDP